MKILHVVKAYYPDVGGIETSARQIAEASAKNGHEVIVLCFGNKTENVETEGVKVYRIKPFFNVGSASISLKYFKKYKELSKDVDIIHFHVPNPLGELAFCLQPKTKSKAKTLCTYHLDPVRPKAFVLMYKMLLNSFMKKVDVICPTSPYYIVSSRVIENFLEKCRTIPLGVEVGSFANVSPEKIAEAEKVVSKLKRPRVLFSGRFAYFKGIPNLLNAMALLPEYSLIMVGDGKKRQETEEQIDRLGLRDRVVLAGLQTGEFYRAFFHVADIFAFPSTWPESFGIVGLEALAAGLPLVTTEIWAGSSYYNEDEKTGLIVPPQDPKALAEAIKRILSNPELHKMMSENARKRADKFALERMPERYEEVYKFLMGKKD
ncbi:MAG: glycosyltransferase [Synergistaceae bacterium]|nr:glycosyltransferase [Synergistaceae bacterium]